MNRRTPKGYTLSVTTQPSSLHVPGHAIASGVRPDVSSVVACEYGWKAAMNRRTPKGYTLSVTTNGSR
jgi:hypothetical protein